MSTIFSRNQCDNKYALAIIYCVPITVAMLDITSSSVPIVCLQGFICFGITPTINPIFYHMFKSLSEQPLTVLIYATALTLAKQ